MQLEKSINILVFKIANDGTFDSIGEINQFDSLIWPDKFNGYATFELWAPITDENALYFEKGNILWCGGENAAVVEIVKSVVDDTGAKTYYVKGRTLEKFLTERIIWQTVNFQNQYASTILYSVVNSQCINPRNANRKIPFLVNASVDEQIGGRISIQKTGGEVYDFVQSICSDCDIGFNIKFDPYEKQMIFTVSSGVDRTVNQSVNDPVEFSTDLEDLLSSSYYWNVQDEKTVAWVQGEDSGTTRKSVISGNNSGVGLLRKELYVDARDLQSGGYDADTGQETHLTPSEYNNVLLQRGNEKLASNQEVENFEANIRVFGDVQYVFGVDYKKGDKVTVRDKQLNVVVSARITEVEEDFDEEYSLILTFGYSYPTIMQKVNSKIT